MTYFISHKSRPPLASWATRALLVASISLAACGDPEPGTTNNENNTNNINNLNNQNNTNNINNTNNTIFSSFSSPTAIQRNPRAL